MKESNNQTRKIQERLGFRIGDRGTQSSRTIMLAELRLLLDALPPDAPKTEYFEAVIQNNILGKRTVSTREYSARRLSELYGAQNAQGRGYGQRQGALGQFQIADGWGIRRETEVFPPALVVQELPGKGRQFGGLKPEF